LGAAEDLPVSRQVALAVEPLDAHVYRDGKDLGTSPVVLDVQEGQPIAVEIRREGFKPRTVKLDGTSAKASVKLEHSVSERGMQRARADHASRTKSKLKPNLASGEIINPWE
jgi:hypothetical protein